MRKERRHFTGKEKVEVLRLHLLEGVPVSEVCERHGLHPTVFYRWQKEFFENGTAAFEGNGTDATGRKLEKEIEALRTKLARKDEVIAEIMEAHVKLKKSLGEL